MAKRITRRQATILEYVIEFIEEMGFPPTIAEICDHFGVKSTNGVNDHLASLERKGYLTRSSKARSIQITDKARERPFRADVGMLPLVGQVAAGLPTLAEENVESFIPMPLSQAREGGFCLRVNGDSMIEAGILDGDIITVDPTARVRKGAIVVALVDQDEATVKYYYPQGDMVELRPANCEMEPIFVAAESLQIQGVVIGLQRDIGR
jgi:repressor LexA